MTDHAPFLHAICARPEDDGPRLIYADWLDENGECERAEFIRVQCELARGRKFVPQDALVEIAESGRLYSGSAQKMLRELSDKYDAETDQLRRRERELLPRQPGSVILHDGNGNSIATGWPVEFHRGFVEEITCSWSDWQRHADAIRAATPIRKVKLTTESDNHLFVSVGGRVWTCATWPGVEFELPRYTDGYGSENRIGRYQLHQNVRDLIGPT
jgi:uncharacterized protein (TIGR02996 family)